MILIIFQNIVVTDRPLCNRQAHWDNTDHLPTGQPIRMIRIIYQNIIITDRPLCKCFEWCIIEIRSIFMSFINNNKILCKVCSWYEHSLMLSVEAQWLLSSSAVRKEDTKPSAKTQDIVLLFVRKTQAFVLLFVRVRKGKCGFSLLDHL